MAEDLSAMLILWVATVGFMWALVALLRHLWLQQRMSKIQMGDASQYSGARILRHAANVARVDLMMGVWLTRLSRLAPLLLILVVTLLWAEPVVARFGESSTYVLVSLGSRTEDFQFVDLAWNGVVTSDVPLVVADGEALAVGQQLQVTKPPAIWADWAWYTQRAIEDVPWLRGILLPWLGTTVMFTLPTWAIFRVLTAGYLTEALVDSARRIKGATVCDVPAGGRRGEYVTVSYDGPDYWERGIFRVDSQREKGDRRPGYALIEIKEPGDWRGVLFFDGLNHYPKTSNISDTPIPVLLREAKEILQDAWREAGVSWWQRRWVDVCVGVVLLLTAIPCLPQFNEQSTDALVAGLILGAAVIAFAAIPAIDNWWRRAGVDGADWPRGGTLGG